MKCVFKRSVTVNLLVMTVSSPALAFDGANLSADGGNGSLILSAFDSIERKSVIVDLGLNYLDFLNSPTSRDGRMGTDVTPDAPYTLSWSIDLSTFNGNLANVQWNVFAVDAAGAAFSTEVLVTAPLNMSSLSVTNGDVVRASVSGYGEIAGQCNSIGESTVCVSPYFEGGPWYTSLNDATSALSASLGTTMGFYALGRSNFLASGTPWTVAYVDSLGLPAQWILQADGTLTYSSEYPPADSPSVVTPLPAALWLLVSGLGGLGIFGRRRVA